MAREQQETIDSFLAAMARRESRPFLFTSGSEEGVGDGFEWRPSPKSRDPSLPPSVYTYLSRKKEIHGKEKDTKEEQETGELNLRGGVWNPEEEEEEKERRTTSLDRDYSSSIEKEKLGETQDKEEGEEDLDKIMKNKTRASYHEIAMERRLQSQHAGWSQALDTLATLAASSSSSSSSKPPYRSSSSPPNRSPGSVTSPGDTALAVADLAMQLAQVYGSANKAFNTINALSSSSSLPLSPSIPSPSTAVSIASYLTPATSAASGLATVVQALSSSSPSSSPQLAENEGAGGRNNSILKTLAQHADSSNSPSANPYLLRSIGRNSLQRSGRRGSFDEGGQGDMNGSDEGRLEKDMKNPQEVWSDEMHAIAANLERLRNQPWRDPPSKPFKRNLDERCVDVNECLEFEQAGIRPCKIDELTCVNTPGTYECRCDLGLEYDEEAASCIDVDECLLAKKLLLSPSPYSREKNFDTNVAVSSLVRLQEQRDLQGGKLLPGLPALCEQRCLNTMGSYQC
ncbi:calcium binding egf domain-containing protein, partial [Cystoisospora suis]